MESSTVRNSWLSAFAAVLPLLILFVIALSIPLAAAQNMGLSPAQTSSWILVLWGLPGILGIVLTYYYKEPILMTGTIFAMIFVGTLGDTIPYDELSGAFILAGIIAFIITALGLTGRLADLIPSPIIYGLLASAILSFVVDIFNAMGQEPLVVGGTFFVYIVSRRVLVDRIPPILPALIAGLLLAGLTGGYGAMPEVVSQPSLEFVTPRFSLNAIVSVTPVIVILLILQANVPSVIYMQSQGYRTPERVISGSSGISTVLASFFGPIAISLSLPATSLIAGPTAGEKGERFRAAYIAGGALVLIGVLAGVATTVTEIIPLPLLLALAGLAVIDIFTGALQQIVRGPLLLGPVFTFVIALSDVTLLGLGSFFWALVIGTSVARVLEEDAPNTAPDGQGN